MTTNGLLTQDLADDLAASIVLLESVDPEVTDPESAMQVLTDLNYALQEWGTNVISVLEDSQELLSVIGPQRSAGLLRGPLLADCAGVYSLNGTMDSVQKDVDETKKAADAFFETDYQKDFEKAENAKRTWVKSYANTARKTGNELVKGPPAAQAGVFMAGATALFIGGLTSVSVVSAPALLTIAAVGIGTDVAVNWLWDFLTPQPSGIVRNGDFSAAPLPVGESCRFISSSAQNGTPSVFSETGVGNLHVFIEDRAPLVFENFSIISGEQITLTVEAPALDGVTADEISDAIEDADITIEELEDDLEPEPTLNAAPTPTQQPAAESPRTRA